ncbi:hypothetical protein AB0E78_11230 [Streptomyces sp. NPDC032198]|uniref:hypothetical protein n=1 Tax=unclassified Streptomyces TaxID=2593676 RepID=UPI0033DA0D5E
MAAHLPAATADTVLTAARDAFTHGMGYAAIGAATVMATAGLFSLALLRGAGSTSPSPAPHASLDLTEAETPPADPSGSAVTTGV